MQRLASLLMLALLPLVCVAQKRVEVWTYHVSPPFIIDETRGLSRALVTLLNVDPRNGGRFHFDLRPLPRKRVDQRLADDRPGVLLWATPRFLSAEQTGRARWSPPLLRDQQDFVSLPDMPFEYDGPTSLRGMQLGGVLGHHYPDLDAEIASGAIRRQDVRSDLQNLQKLLSGRIHTLLIPRSTLLYYRKERKLGDLYVSAVPLYQFTRHLLITDTLGKPATEYLEDFVATLPDNLEWQILLFRYGLEPIASEP